MANTVTTKKCGDCTFCKKDEATSYYYCAYKLPTFVYSDLKRLNIEIDREISLEDSAAICSVFNSNGVTHEILG